MAKKKTSNVQGDKTLQRPQDTVSAHQQVTPSMESEGSEKIDQLKYLNQMLLKETVERRQQLQSLVQENNLLETEVARSKSERDGLKSELTRLGESVARMELEGVVVADFLAVQVGLKGEDAERRVEGLEMENKGLKSEIGEKESEIGRLSGKLSKIEGLLGDEREGLMRISMERDRLKSELDVKTKEIKRLREVLSASEEGKGEMVQRFEELRDTYTRAVGANEELEMRIESITREKDSLVRSLEGANKLKEALNEELGRVVRGRQAIEEEKNVEILKREGLEIAVSELNEMVVGLQKEEEKLQLIVAEFEKRSHEGEERQKDLRREIDQLVEEKKLSERKIEGFLVEKTVMEEEFGKVTEQLDELKVKIEELVNEKIVSGEAKTQLEGEVFVLHNEITELMDNVSRLEECKQAEEKRAKSLECELEEYRRKLEVVKSDNAEMKNHLCGEKEYSEALKGIVEELESKVEESIKSVEKAKAENAAILAVKMELDSERKMLSQKVASLESAITEARNEYDCMRGKAELADAKLERLLNMLKDAVAFCSNNENPLLMDGKGGDMDGDLKCVDDDVMVYVKELEMIKNALKSKASRVENMERELEFLQNSVEEAHKKKGFWTMLSSAATVMAAVSVAYIARGH